jgi:hypothetical protein
VCMMGRVICFGAGPPPACAIFQDLLLLWSSEAGRTHTQLEERLGGAIILRAALSPTDAAVLSFLRIDRRRDYLL